MKAIVYERYGPPEVAQLKEVTKPVPRENDVLVKIHATTVNRTDCGFRSAEYFIVRFWSGLITPNNKILGCEFAGVVEEVGRNVTLFKAGDKVFGYNDKTFGGHAEYMTMNENDSIAHMPDNVSFHQATASPRQGTDSRNADRVRLTYKRRAVSKSVCISRTCFYQPRQTPRQTFCRIA